MILRITCSAFLCVLLGGLCCFAAADPSSPKGGSPQMVRVDDGRVVVETSTLTAVLEKGFITSLKSKQTGEEFIRQFDVNQEAALQLLYCPWEAVPIAEGVSQFYRDSGDRTHEGAPHGTIRCLQLSPQRAEIIFHGWDGDGVIAVSADPETGDLIVEPSAYSSRAGVRACRWVLRGIRTDLELVAPFNQGAKLKLDDRLIKGSWREWPQQWEAGLAILQGESSGFWVHCQDDRYRYKAIKIGTGSDDHAIALDTEAYGPLDDNLGAGGLAWRVNVYHGDWRVPAARYREWLWEAYDLEQAEEKRPDWLHKLTLAISWCPTDLDLLDALAERVPPERVLLHLPNWRTDPYDENYPTYEVSEEGRQFIQKARAMGFHVAPHFNTVDMDPTHPVYPLVRDFQYRDVASGRVQGWTYDRGNIMAVAESNLARTKHRDKKLMVKIHPGLAMWRSVLGESILKAAQDLSLDLVFTDVSLCTSNLHNCLVDGVTPPEGMLQLINHVAGLGDGLVVGGEGLNEITMQGHAFAQAHLLTQDPEGLKRAAGCDLNQFLWGKLCRIIGYSGCSGRTETDALCRRVYDSQGAIPTLIIGSADDVRNPTPEVNRVLQKAGGR